MKLTGDRHGAYGQLRTQRSLSGRSSPRIFRTAHSIPRSAGSLSAAVPPNNRRRARMKDKLQSPNCHGGPQLYCQPSRRGSVPVRRFYVVLPSGDVHPMKQWLRQHPEHIPENMHPNHYTSHQIREGLRRAGWQVQERADEVGSLPRQLSNRRPNLSRTYLGKVRRWKMKLRNLKKRHFILKRSYVILSPITLVQLISVGRCIAKR